MGVVAQFEGDGVSVEIRDDDVSGDLTEVEFSGNLSRAAKVCLNEGEWSQEAYSTHAQPVSIQTGHPSSSATFKFKDKT